jgi:hypothetical protein
MIGAEPGEEMPVPPSVKSPECAALRFKRRPTSKIGELCRLHADRERYALGCGGSTAGSTKS